MCFFLIVLIIGLINFVLSRLCKRDLNLDAFSIARHQKEKKDETWI